MLHALGPAQVADMDKAVDSVLDFDESTEISQVANAAFDGHTDRELLMQRIPWVGCQLAHAEGDATLRWIDVEHNAFDLIADIDELRRVFHALRPGHLADVDEALDSLLKFDEGSVVGHTDDASLDVSALGITMLGIKPRIRCELLESERNTLFVFVVLQNFDLDLIADVYQVFRVSK